MSQPKSTQLKTVELRTVRFLFLPNGRYELAQQLQPQSAEDPLGGVAVAHEVQVEIEEPPAPTAEQQSMLGLSEAEVVNGTQTVTLEAPLTDQALVQGEGKTYSSAIHGNSE